MDDAQRPGGRPLPLPVPLSFGGVASVAHRSGWCLFAWQIVFALLIGSAIAWSVDTTWGRAIRHASLSLPDQAAIRAGRLLWPNADRAVLHQGPFVALVVDPPGSRESAPASDVTVFLEGDGIAFRSLLGWAAFPYPAGVEASLSRLEVAGLLEAWQNPARLAVALVSASALLLSWWALSTAYSVILWWCAGVLGRRTTLAVAWRTAGSALLAPGLLMTGAILLYATRNLTFIGFLLALPLHLVAGWLYCAGGLTQLPAAVAPGENPFGDLPAPKARPTAETVEAEAEADANPFRTSE